jgi:hypothetical protein
MFFLPRQAEEIAVAFFCYAQAGMLTYINSSASSLILYTRCS